MTKANVIYYLMSVIVNKFGPDSMVMAILDQYYASSAAIFGPDSLFIAILDH